jgi:hypothetical protein
MLAAPTAGSRDEARRIAANIAKLPGAATALASEEGVVSMNQSTNFTAELDQTDEDIFYEVSDETLEAAAGTHIGGQAMATVGPTILIGGCC